MNEETPNSILIPAPTTWPFIVALGFSLILAGLVTHAAVSVVGALILLRGSIGWWFDVLPAQKEEMIAMSPASQVSRSSLAVDRLAAGHRAQIPVEVHPYWTGLLGGLAGAGAVAAVAMLFWLLFQGSVWYPLKLLAAGVIRTFAQAPIAPVLGFIGRRPLPGKV